MLIDSTAIFLYIQARTHAISAIGSIIVMIENLFREISFILSNDIAELVLNFRFDHERTHDWNFLLATLILAY